MEFFGKMGQISNEKYGLIYSSHPIPKFFIANPMGYSLNNKEKMNVPVL